MNKLKNDASFFAYNFFLINFYHFWTSKNKKFTGNQVFQKKNRHSAQIFWLFFHFFCLQFIHSTFTHIRAINVSECMQTKKTWLCEKNFKSRMFILLDKINACSFFCLLLAFSLASVRFSIIECVLMQLHIKIHIKCNFMCHFSFFHPKTHISIENTHISLSIRIKCNFMCHGVTLCVFQSILTSD